MNASKIIQALHEEKASVAVKRNKDGEVEIEFDEDEVEVDLDNSVEDEEEVDVEESDDYDDEEDVDEEDEEEEEDEVVEPSEVEEGMLVYRDPSNNAYFVTEGRVRKITSPFNEAVEVRPEYVGRVTRVLEPEEDEEDEDEVTEARVRVSNGKVIRLRGKKRKKGFKRVNGKYVKMSAKEKRSRAKNLKKARRKANTSSAKRKRSKSMRRRGKMNASYSIDESLVVENINESIESFYDGLEDKYHVPTFENVSRVAIKGENLILEGLVSYDDGVSESVRFIIENFKEGESTVHQDLGSSIFGESSELVVDAFEEYNLTESY